MNKSNDNSSRARKTRLNSFTQLLIESDTWCLPFIGKCLQFFGIKIGKKTVIALILGIILPTIIIYGYTLIYNHLPFIKNHFEVTGVTNHAPVLSSVPTSMVYKNVGDESSFVAKATDEDNNLKEEPFSLKDPDGSGSEIDPETGQVTLKMDKSDRYEITVIAKDKFDAIDYQTFTLTDQKIISLSGFVKTVKGEDIKPFCQEFDIIIGKRCGPFNKTTLKNGSFIIPGVTFSQRYHIMVWPENLKDLSNMYEITKINQIGYNQYCLDGDLSLMLSD